MLVVSVSSVLLFGWRHCRIHCVVEAEVRYWNDEGAQGVREGHAHLDAKDVATPVC